MTTLRSSPSVEHRYRVPLNFWTAFAVAVPYVAILVVMQKASGVSLTEVSDTAENVRDFITIPVAVATAYLVVVGLVTGWISSVWTERNRLEEPSWLNWFLYLTVFVIVLNFATGNIASQAGDLVMWALVGTVCVGISEELMFRGYLLQGARASGFAEPKVALVTSIVFGITHGINILSGEAVGAVLVQVLNAVAFGLVLYFIFRHKGALVLLMVLHFLWDFSIFTKGDLDDGDLRAVLGLLSWPVTVVMVILVIKAWGYLTGSKPTAGQPQQAS